MDEGDWLAARFEQHRTRLTAVAYRMLGSPSEADDVVQEAWLRFNRSDTSAVENLGSWLTTVVSRLCLNILQTRRSRPEVPLDSDSLEAEPMVSHDSGVDPEEEMLLADSIGLALLVVLDTLTPAERVAFVLHDMFAVSFEEIAPILGRSPGAARQLASRARRRVQGQGRDRDSDGLRQSKLVDAFLAAARKGNFHALLALLDPDVVLRADQAAVHLGAAQEIRGAPGVATFARRAQGAKPALVNGAAGAVWMPGGRPRVVFVFTISGDKIISIDLIADPERFGQIDLIIPSR
jgi:RNA polymerase sigma factor (sigma-70 family)